MIRTLVMTLLLSSVSYANDCNTQLQLSCNARYLSQGADIFSQSASSFFEDENWDEPSLKNCAAATYIGSSILPSTTVRVYAQKNLYGDFVATTGTAIQIFDSIVNGQVRRSAMYSNYTDVNTVVGQDIQLGVLRLPKALKVGELLVTDIAVTCSVK